MFRVFPVSSEKPPYDSKVIETILNFIIDFFENRNAIIAFNYSPAGGKHLFREEYFKKLYNKYHNGKLDRIDLELGGDDRGAMIFRTDNIHSEALHSTTGQDIVEKLDDKTDFIET